MLSGWSRAGRAAGAVVMAITLAACSDSSESTPTTQPAVSEDNPTEGFTSRVVEVDLTMEASGDVSVAVDQVARLQIIEIISDDVPEITWFLSVAAGGPVTLDDGRLLLFSADLSPGLYRGPGTYELSTEGAAVVGDRSGISSGAYLQVVSPDQIGARRFDRFGEPCTLEVSDGQRTGSLTCPSLLDADGATISLTWTWRLR